jgi:hypothetical protein
MLENRPPAENQLDGTCRCPGVNGDQTVFNQFNGMLLGGGSCTCPAGTQFSGRHPISVIVKPRNPGGAAANPAVNDLYCNCPQTASGIQMEFTPAENNNPPDCHCPGQTQWNGALEPPDCVCPANQVLSQNTPLGFAAIAVGQALPNQCWPMCTFWNDNTGRMDFALPGESGDVFNAAYEHGCVPFNAKCMANGTWNSTAPGVNLVGLNGVSNAPTGLTNNNACAGNGDCCSGDCAAGVCKQPPGDACNAGGDCDTGYCCTIDHVCKAPPSL